MKTSLHQKFLTAIERGRLKLVSGKKSWYSYKLDIHELVWARNLRDGYDIHVYNKDSAYLATITI